MPADKKTYDNHICYHTSLCCRCQAKFCLLISLYLFRRRFVKLCLAYLQTVHLFMRRRFFIICVYDFLQGRFDIRNLKFCDLIVGKDNISASITPCASRTRISCTRRLEPILFSSSSGDTFSPFFVIIRFFKRPVR